MKIIIKNILMVIIIASLCGCRIESENNKLESLTYNKYKDESEYTVMIKENNNYVPYYVITDNYNKSGNCLLLRKNLIEENIPFYTEKYNSVYYDSGYIHYYLNNEFEKRFTKEFLDIVIDTDLIITDSEGITAKEHKLSSVTSKFFILSKKEVTGRHSTISKAEGEYLNFFDGLDNLKANRDGLKYGKCSWWLRTPCLQDDSVANAVGENGAVGIVGIYGPNGPYVKSIRPAFCLNSKSLIKVLKSQNYLVNN